MRAFMLVSHQNFSWLFLLHSIIIHVICDWFHLYMRIYNSWWSTKSYFNVALIRIFFSLKYYIVVAVVAVIIIFITFGSCCCFFFVPSIIHILRVLCVMCINILSFNLSLAKKNNFKLKLCVLIEIYIMNLLFLAVHEFRDSND